MLTIDKRLLRPVLPPGEHATNPILTIDLEHRAPSERTLVRLFSEAIRVDISMVQRPANMSTLCEVLKVIDEQLVLEGDQHLVVELLNCPSNVPLIEELLVAKAKGYKVLNSVPGSLARILLDYARRKPHHDHAHDVHALLRTLSAVADVIVERKESLLRRLGPSVESIIPLAVELGILEIDDGNNVTVKAMYQRDCLVLSDS